MMQRRAARRIFHDFSHSTSDSALVTRLELLHLETRKRVDKVAIMYKVVNNLVDFCFYIGNSLAKQQNYYRSAAETPSTIFQDQCAPRLLLSFYDPTTDPQISCELLLRLVLTARTVRLPDLYCGILPGSWVYHIVIKKNNSSVLFSYQFVHWLKLTVTRPARTLL